LVTVILNEGVLSVTTEEGLGAVGALDGVGPRPSIELGNSVLVRVIGDDV